MIGRLPIWSATTKSVPDATRLAVDVDSDLTTSENSVSITDQTTTMPTTTTHEESDTPTALALASTPLQTQLRSILQSHPGNTDSPDFVYLSTEEIAEATPKDEFCSGRARPTASVTITDEAIARLVGLDEVIDIRLTQITGTGANEIAAGAAETWMACADPTSSVNRSVQSFANPAGVEALVLGSTLPLDVGQAVATSFVFSRFDLLVEVRHVDFTNGASSLHPIDYVAHLQSELR